MKTIQTQKIFAKMLQEGQSSKPSLESYFPNLLWRQSRSGRFSWRCFKRVNYEASNSSVGRVIVQNCSANTKPLANKDKDCSVKPKWFFSLNISAYLIFLKHTNYKILNLAILSCLYGGFKIDIVSLNSDIVSNIVGDNVTQRWNEMVMVILMWWYWWVIQRYSSLSWSFWRMENQRMPNPSKMTETLAGIRILF